MKFGNVFRQNSLKFASRKLQPTEALYDNCDYFYDKTAQFKTIGKSHIKSLPEKYHGKSATNRVKKELKV